MEFHANGSAEHWEVHIDFAISGSEIIHNDKLVYSYWLVNKKFSI